MTKALGIIPARWGSTRFPGKPLHLIAGKPLLQRVWERCCRAKRLDSVIVATDDMRIAKAAFSWGAEVALTSPHHQSGTDRIAEVAKKARQFGYIVNIQGDEPLIEPRLIDRLVKTLRSNASVQMVTAAHPFSNPRDTLSPHQVKVAVDARGRALYFSRSPIPYPHAGGGRKVALAASRWDVGQRPMSRQSRCSLLLRHQGIYGFRRDVLLKFVRWKPTPLEKMEALEQLRALENGVTVHVLVTKHGTPGVDTPEDAKSLDVLLRKPSRCRVSGTTKRRRR